MKINLIELKKAFKANPNNISGHGRNVAEIRRTKGTVEIWDSFQLWTLNIERMVFVSEITRHEIKV